MIRYEIILWIWRWETIPKYDTTWYDTIDSDRNESYPGDENDEYIKPTCNDSDPNVAVGYASFDDHNESRPIDEPVKAHLFNMTFYITIIWFISYRL